MLGGAGAGLYGYRAQGRRPPLGEHHAVYAGAVGYAQESAEVLRVFYAIESQKQPGSVRFPGGRLEEVLDGEKLQRADHGHHALVGGGLGQQRQLVAGFLTDADTGLAAQGYKPLQTVILTLAGHQYVVETPPSGLEGLFDRMHPVENFHDG